jgi:heat shock protein HslJ
MVDATASPFSFGSGILRSASTKGGRTEGCSVYQWFVLIRRVLTPLVAVSIVLVVAACLTRSSSTTLPGTSWTVTSIGGIATTGTQPTLVFGADGTVSGTTSCNEYTGQVTIDGDRITITQTSSTMRACAENAANAQEAAFTAALEGARTWGIASDGSLEINGAADIVATVAPQQAT